MVPSNCSHLRRHGRRGCRRCKGPFQSLASPLLPGMQGLARDLHAATQRGDDPILSLVGQQVAGAGGPLGRCARMCMNHWFLPGGAVVVTHPPYHQGCFLHAMNTKLSTWPGVTEAVTSRNLASDGKPPHDT